MKTTLILPLFCIATMVSVLIPTSAPAEGYSDFKLIPNRNIFNPNRQPSSRFNTIRRNGNTTAPRPTDSISLVGTLSYKKGDFAFFDGTRSEFCKSAQSGDDVAGFTIIAVGTNFVKLGQGNDVFLVTIGTALRRDLDGNWAIPNSAYLVGGRSRRNSSWQRDYGTNRPPVETGAEVAATEATNEVLSTDSNTAGQDMIQPEMIIISDMLESTAATDESRANGETGPAPAGNPNDPLTRLMQQRALEEQQLQR